MPITWKNVGSNTAAAAAASSRAMETASNMQNNALSSLEDMAKMQRDTQIANVAQGRENHTDHILNTLSGFKTAEEAQNFRESGGLEQLLANPRSYNQDEVRGKFDSRLNSLYTSDQATIDRNEAELQRKVIPIEQEYQRRVLANDPTAKDYFDANQAILDQAGLSKDLMQFTLTAGDAARARTETLRGDEIRDISSQLIGSLSQKIEASRNGTGNVDAKGWTDLTQQHMAEFDRALPNARPGERQAHRVLVDTMINNKTRLADRDVARLTSAQSNLKREYKNNSLVQSLDTNIPEAVDAALLSAFPVDSDGERNIPNGISAELITAMDNGVEITDPATNEKVTIKLPPEYVAAFLSEAAGSWGPDTAAFKSKLRDFLGQPGVLEANEGLREYERADRELRASASAGALTFDQLANLNDLQPVPVNAQKWSGTKLDAKNKKDKEETPQPIEDVSMISSLAKGVRRDVANLADLPMVAIDAVRKASNYTPSVGEFVNALSEGIQGRDVAPLHDIGTRRDDAVDVPNFYLDSASQGAAATANYLAENLNRENANAAVENLGNAAFLPGRVAQTMGAGLVNAGSNFGDFANLLNVDIVEKVDQALKSAKSPATALNKFNDVELREALARTNDPKLRTAIMKALKQQ